MELIGIEGCRHVCFNAYLVVKKAIVIISEYRSLKAGKAVSRHEQRVVCKNSLVCKNHVDEVAQLAYLLNVWFLKT